jgi:FkbM family methyltransferase
LKKWSRKKKAVHPLQIAVSDGSKQEIELAVHPFSMAALSTVEPTLMSKERMPGWKKKVRVKAASLDELTKSCTQKVRLIKLDVEGHEESVFKGATQLLENDSPFLIFEYGIEPSHFEPQTIEWLQKKNYVCFDLMTLQKMEQAPKAAYFTDIVAIPEKKLSEIKPLLDALAYVMRARTS